MDRRRSTLRLAAALLVVALASALCSTARGGILFSTIARDGSLGSSPDPPPPNRAVFLAHSPSAAAAFTRWLRPAEKEAVQRVDWREYVVLAAVVWVSTVCDPADIAEISRKRTTLVVRVVVTRHVLLCAAVNGWRYHVVKLRRAALRPLPRHVVLKIVHWP